MFWRVLYEIFIILLVITYAIVIFADPSHHPGLTQNVIEQIDTVLIVFLVLEYVVRLWRAKQKRRFIVSNWFDLVAMIPLDHYFYLARFMRVIRLMRILKASPFLWGVISSTSIRWIFAIVSLIMLWSSAGIYLLETGVNKNITHFGDAVWWSVVTTTTVGYGDISPVTTGGRILATILMFTGIGLIGALTANFANHWAEFFETESKTNADRIKQELNQNAIKHIQNIDQLSEEEYETLLQTLQMLRVKKLSEKTEETKSC